LSPREREPASPGAEGGAAGAPVVDQSGRGRRATLRGVEELADKRGLKWTSEAREGDPADVLVDLAEEHGADVLVIGNKGMQRRVLGSVPNSVSHKANCSVMIVKTT